MFSKTVALLNQSLRSEERRVGTHLFRAAMAIGVLGLVAYMHLLSLRMRGNAPGFVMMALGSFLLFGVLTLAGALYFPVSITEEKERGAIGLLRMANIGPTTLLAGKSLSRLCGVMLVVALTLPFWWLAVTLGGVMPRQVLAAAIILFAHLILMSQIGTFFSVICRTTDAACLASLATIAALLGGPYAIEELVNEFIWSSGGTGRFSLLWMQNWFAPQLLIAALRPGSLAPLVPLACVAQLAVAAALFGLSALVFDHFVPSDTSPIQGGLRHAFTRITGRKLKAAAVVTPKPPQRAEGEAVAWKDFHQFAGGPKWLRVRFWLLLAGSIAIGALALFDLSSRNAAWDMEEFAEMLGGFVAICSLYAVGLELYVQTAFVFSREIRDQTWDSLRMLPLTLRELCQRKAKGALSGLLPGLVFLSAGLLLLGAVEVAQIDGWIREFQRYWPDVLSGTVFAVCAAVHVLHLVGYFSLRTNPWAGMALAYFATIASISGPFVLLMTALDLERKGLMWIAMLLESLLLIVLTEILRRQIARMLRGEQETA